MATRSYDEIKQSLRRLYLDDSRPWLVGFSGGKDSTMVASLIVETIAGITDAGRHECRVSSVEGATRVGECPMQIDTSTASWN
jgi:DNA sulfur modification protein DndC